MSFRGYLEDLERAGLIAHVHEPVSPVQEVTERSWGRGPVLFHDVSGHRCCLNILGTRELLARALGVPPGIWSPIYPGSAARGQCERWSGPLFWRMSPRRIWAACRY